MNKRKYYANYHHANGEITTAYFDAYNLKEAKSLAQFHKRHTPELKGVTTMVALKRD